MDERGRRIGRNEAVFREVNEQIEGLNTRLAAVGERVLHVVCECGNLECVDQLTLPVAIYEEVRADPATFLVKPGHEIPDVETVVRREREYFVVRKEAGGPERLAAETDPRS
ncbi:MAG TPA: hypothetical protein VHC67_07205 [Gaiellaceae bacterium]|jgi:hypothetical protein|nr:hypothetical protein [Gaiellaceae bacterium]